MASGNTSIHGYFQTIFQNSPLAFPLLIVWCGCMKFVVLYLKLSMMEMGNLFASFRIVWSNKIQQVHEIGVILIWI